MSGAVTTRATCSSTGGQSLQPNQSISGFGTYNQTGGTLVFNVTQNTTPGTYPTLSANAINLRGGSLVLVPGGNLTALAAQGTTVYKNAILADPPLTGSFASVATPNLLFKASTHARRDDAELARRGAHLEQTGCHGERTRLDAGSSPGARRTARA